MPSATASADQIDFWNEVQGPKWVRLQERIDATLGPIGDAAMAKLAPRDGEHILDVGSGCGTTSLTIADKVGPQGKVTGADISKPMIEHARERAKSVEAIDFIEADAQTHRFDDATFDGVFSRFGVMFFPDPAVAFANLRAATKPGGRLAFGCWRDVRENEWITTVVQIARDFVELPPRPGPDEPGQFSFADEARVRRILTTAGWSRIKIDRYDTKLPLGDTPLDAAEFLMQMGPAGSALAETDDGTRGTVANRLLEALKSHEGRTGVHLGSSSWIVTAVRD